MKCCRKKSSCRDIREEDKMRGKKDSFEVDNGGNI